jgi:hypothetical protein
MSLFDIFRRKKDKNTLDYDMTDDYDDYMDDEEGEMISIYDAADIWASNGKDEDYTFGYSEEELEDALNS